MTSATGGATGATGGATGATGADGATGATGSTGATGGVYYYKYFSPESEDINAYFKITLTSESKLKTIDVKYNDNFHPTIKEVTSTIIDDTAIFNVMSVQFTNANNSEDSINKLKDTDIHIEGQNYLPTIYLKFINSENVHR
jgi:hypothetical protein